MQTRALRTFLEIGTTGSFALAAQRLHMTLSAVSMQMKTLETELDTQLFDRAHRPPKLTPMGRRLQIHAARVIAEEDALTRACQSSDILSGSYRIGFVATASVRLLPRLLIRAARDAPQARFDFETALSRDLEDMVLSGRLDGGVLTASPTPPTGLTYHHLQTERLVFVAPNDLADHTLPELFTALPFFHFLPRSGIGKIIAAQIEPAEGPTRNRVYLDSVTAIMECVNEGIGFTLLPEPDVQRYLSPTARILQSASPSVTRDLVLATSNADHVMDCARHLQRLLKP